MKPVGQGAMASSATPPRRRWTRRFPRSTEWYVMSEKLCDCISKINVANPDCQIPKKGIIVSDKRGVLKHTFFSELTVRAEICLLSTNS